MEKQFFFDFEEEIKDKNLEPNPDNNKQLLNKITNTSGDNLESCKNINIKKQYNPYIESKYTKIVRHKKMTLITRKL